MKLAKNIEKESLVTKFEDNKDLLLPVGVLVGGIFLILFLVLPQVMSFPAKLAQRNAEIARLDEIKASKEILANTNITELETQVDKVSNALPIDKDFEAIFNSISQAANASNTQIIGYVFSDGGQVDSEDNTNPARALKFMISINGTPDQAALFLEELYKAGPIADIKKIEYVDGGTELEIDFYYKPFTAIDQNSFLPKALTAEQLEVYSEISNFIKPSSEPVFDFPQDAQDASPSSELLESEEN